ncbi:hypothetical protein E4U43_004942 [Claviceps pusilla]|uniref:Vps72/YL1 C-terminal domain-containing protein n=1 Tax=Claviceps pusilla TaxID=123648 RepID=A0A9P7NGS1_9HYPO|nr:hypothetical protein E4U43_004942 [Claviceps pusilla]
MSDQDTSQLSEPLSDLESLSDSGSPIQQTAWLATTRERRSTAGNRMKSVLANEEPDSDLELLFAEDENDQGFSDADEDGSDVQMDSSSDDEDDANADADELEGEKELERQAKAKRAAQRKRRAQEAIPAKFRKKVRIDPATTGSTAAAAAAAAPPPPPRPSSRPKKKSERTSWLPSAADLPTRASSRKTTRISKEQLHLQMAEREARRLKQLAQMEKKAARLEAMKKPPMTQEERLAEAAVVEKRNSKSLNRWEEAEKQREQERKAKLAALNQRTLKGPFITFWSGKGQWDDLELRSLRPYVTEVEEKPKKKKKEKAADKGGARMKGKNKDNNAIRATDGHEKDDATGGEPGQMEDVNSNDTKIVATRGPDDVQKPAAEMGPSVTSGSGQTNKDRHTNGNELDETMVTSIPTQSPDVLISSAKTPPPNGDNAPPVEKQLEVTLTLGVHVDGKPKEEPKQSSTPAKMTDTHTNSIAKQSDEMTASRSSPTACVSTKIDVPGSPSGPSSSTTPGTTKPATPLAPPTASALSNATTTDSAAPPPPPPVHTALAAPSSLSRPHEPRSSGALAAPILAPPPGMDLNGSLRAEAPKSNILAPPTISLSEPSQGSQLEPRVSTETTAVSMDVTTKAEMADVSSQPLLNETAPTSKKNVHHTDPGDPAPAAQPEPPRDMNATRNGIIFQNFNDVALRDKNIQTMVLFGRKMHKLAKPTAPPVCVITNNPARYQDPKTGLPFYNMYAYKELQRLYHGEYKWSRLLGAWVGSGSQAAKGVPERFLHPSQSQSKTAEAKSESEPRARDTPSDEAAKPKRDRDAAQSDKGEGRPEQQQSGGVEGIPSPDLPGAGKPAGQIPNGS